MIEVKVRRQHDVDVVCAQAGRRERVVEIPAAFGGELVLERQAALVPHPRIDQHRSRAAHDELTDRQLDAIVLVRGEPGVPNRSRHNAEYRAAIETERPIAQRDDLQITHLMPGSAPDELTAAARKHYAGPVTVGRDLLEV